MGNILKKINKIALKVRVHCAVKAKYAVQKARYFLFNKVGISERKRNERLIKEANNYNLQVFLTRPLDEISESIQKDKPFYELVVKAGESACNDEWLVLNEYRQEMRDASIGHYRWTEDFFTHYKYKDCFYMDVRKQVVHPRTDVKIPWETSRMQYLFGLAMAYRATKNEKYANKAKDIILDFDACCPVGHGVNWHVSMEVGIRIANILLACELMWDSVSFDSDFKRFLAIIVYEHMKHIRKNIENEKNGGNHLLADLLGLAVTTSAMPFLPGAAKHTSYVHKMLHREICRQILPDGGHFEGSVSYHRLVGEILCFSVMAQASMGFVLTAKERDLLFKMGEFTAALRMDNGLVPQLGDNDSGRVFQLVPENTRDHDSFINLVSFLISDTVVYPQKQDGFLCFYNADAMINPSLYPQKTVQEFPFFKLLRYRNNGVFLTFCGMTPEDQRKGGHSHNDVLSLTLAVGNEEVITDPGSGEYTGNAEIRRKLRSAHNHSVISVDGMEQRILPKNSALAFSWDSTLKSSLRVLQNDSGEMVFEGECSYKNEEGNFINQKRIITLGDYLITVNDQLNGMIDECSFALPIFPGLKVCETDHGTVVKANESDIHLEGSYTFSRQPSVFSVQYKKIQPCEVIKCNSKTESNFLKIIVEKP